MLATVDGSRELTDGDDVTALAEGDAAKALADSSGAAERVTVPQAVIVMALVTMMQASRTERVTSLLYAVSGEGAEQSGPFAAHEVGARLGMVPG